MDDVVGVCFKPTGKVYYFSVTGFALRPGDFVIAETTRGQELAEVVCQGVHASRTQADLKPILRRATPEDVEQHRENQRRADEARRVCQRLIAQLEMAVKLVDVEYAFDGSRICFSFASEERTDFRQLQRELGHIYDCAIDIRQIGVRDQAKILGGIGPCGRHLCCASFLRSFEPVTIRMAKDQDLSLNPTKISGLCGRLMCCLRYEHAVYRDARKQLPRVGAQVQTKYGAGEVTAVDMLRGRLTVTTSSGTFQLEAGEVTDPARPAAEPEAPGAPLDTQTAGPTETTDTGAANDRPADRRSRRPGSRRRPEAQETIAPTTGHTEAGKPKSEPDDAKPKRRGRRRRSRRPRRRGGGSAPAAPQGGTPAG